MGSSRSPFEVPKRPIPFPKEHRDADAFVDELLHFMTTSETLQTLCGGVHILDFFTRDPDIYSTILPLSWRNWLASVPIHDLLDLLMREDLEWLLKYQRSHSSDEQDLSDVEKQNKEIPTWKGKDLPPLDFLEYVCSIRSFCLERNLEPSKHVPSESLSRRLRVGMKTKKIHEVVNFAAFVDSLDTYINEESRHSISHIVDFGSGQNYLGRVLASPLYQKSVIAVESKQLNINGAKLMDVSAKLAPKPVVRRNKKAFRAVGVDSTPQPEPASRSMPNGDSNGKLPVSLTDDVPICNSKDPSLGNGKIQYVEHEIEDGHLDPVIEQFEQQSSVADLRETDVEGGITDGRHDSQLMVVSLHSCGNLLHHGVRSLILNPKVKAVAMIGCCYNLTTERLGHATYKLPGLRSPNQRLVETSSAHDPHGFPMSERMCKYKHKNGEGIRWNITARMMAVQAPHNWTPSDCDSFFTRHFYRALLQRIFLDRGVVESPKPTDGADDLRESGVPIIIGSLRKACYGSFVAYVRGALKKLMCDPNMGSLLKKPMETLTDAEIAGYEGRFQHKKHELCIVWSLMAFSATVIEAAFVTDRWLYLTEQAEVERCWVQTVFDYSQSPRNLVVVGIKR